MNKLPSVEITRIIESTYGFDVESPLHGRIRNLSSKPSARIFQHSKSDAENQATLLYIECFFEITPVMESAIAMIFLQTK